MMRFLVTLLVFVFLFSCKSDQVQTTSSSPTVQQKVTPQFTSLPNDMMMLIWNKGDLIDYIFHNLPFSMNQNEQASIRTNLTYISEEVQANIPANCKPFGRQFFGVDGDIVFEADIYYSEQCMFYVFFVDGKAKYANKMSNAGKEFFTTMIQKGMQARKQISTQ